MSDEEKEEIYNDIYNDDMDWYILRIDEEICKDYSTKELDSMFYNDPADFIKYYCLDSTRTVE